MLTCRTMTDLVTTYLEGRLSWFEWAQFQFHLGLCRPCRRYLRQMRLTVLSMGELPPEPLPDGLRKELLARFRDPNV